MDYVANLKQQIGFVFFSYVVYKVYKKIQSLQRQTLLLNMAKKKRTERDKRREILKDGLQGNTDNDASITSLSAVQVRDRIADGTLSYEEVVTAFSRRALECGEKYTCVTEEFYDKAVQEARRRDMETVKPVRILEGVPISIKDQLYQEGADSTCGLAVRCFKPSSSHGLLLELLVDAGAIPFVRSNVPQSLLLPESTNAIWGQAKNPWAPCRTPGGSSGGEGGLVAYRGSPLGIGTDIGGSVRIPAHYCGIYAFKPTPLRITRSGLAAPRKDNKNGQNGIMSAVGPLSNCVEDLALCMRAWLVPKMWERDPTVPPVPFNLKEYHGKRKLKIGYYDNDGYFDPAPACRRAVHEAVRALREAGCEVVKFTPPDTKKMTTTYMSIISADGNMRSFLEGLEGEALHPTYQTIYLANSVPESFRPLMVKILQGLGQHRLAEVVSKVGQKSCYQYWKLIEAKKDYIKTFIDQWKEAGIDAVVCPGNALPAMPHGMSKDLVSSLSYGFMFNLLHFPAGIVPVTTTREDECDYHTEHKDKWARLAKEVVNNSAGLPIGVHVATLPFQDELCLRVMGMLEKEVKFKTVPWETEASN